MRLTERDLEVAMEVNSHNADATTDPIATKLYEALKRGDVSRELMTALLPSLWRYRQDKNTLPIDAWRTMFKHAYFTSAYRKTRRPRFRTITIYRGATEANREGISWSLDRGQARYFAQSRQDPNSREPTYVWTCQLPPGRQLANIGNMSFEAEIVADVRGLNIARGERVL